MKKFLSSAIGLIAAIGFISSAEAITVTLAEVQNGLAVVQGNKAAKSAIITWDGVSVTQTSKGGSFSFSGTVPADCVGALSDGVTTIDVTLANCSPVSQGGGVLKTGQTTCYDSLGSTITCTGTGQDGEFQAGTPIPNPRFTDNGDGTVTDNLTRLIWLKDAGCIGVYNWANALTNANTLADGNVACSLSDGSVAGDWRLPNRNEFQSLLDLGMANPSLPAGHPFLNVALSYYWSSTSIAEDAHLAWIVAFTGGVNLTAKYNTAYVTAVRGGS